MGQRFPPNTARRIELTTSVRDSDEIPKVADAGAVQNRDGRNVQLMHNGLLIEEGCYYGDWMTEIIRRLKGHHEPQEELVFHNLVSRVAEGRREAPTMVELGSYWAYYSAWFQRSLPGARTIMVEPDAHNLEVGRNTFELNGFAGDFLHAAVGPTHGGKTWIEYESDDRVRRVPTVTLAGLLKDYALPHVDLVLCDIQGGELEMLENAQEALLARRVRFILVSTHHHIYSGDPLTHQRCLKFLSGNGAHIIAEHSVSESCSGDGMIAASFDQRDSDMEVLVSHVRARNSLFGELEYELAHAKNLRLVARSQALRGLIAARRIARREWRDDS